MKNEFISIDVETADSNRASICQIGVAKFRDGVVVDEWSSLINPWDADEEAGYVYGVDAEEDENYEFSNTFIHGITLADVQGAPYFSDVLPRLREVMKGKIAIQHSGFDKNALHKATLSCGEDEIETRWLDSAKVVRCVWEDRRKKGYGLKEVSDMLGYKFKHHDALADAKAAGNIINHALKLKEMDLDELIKFTNNKPYNRITREGSEGKSLSGQVIVFTGALSMIRREAADLVASLGSKVASSITKKTTMLIIGDNGEGTSKHKKVMTNMENGQYIHIMSESDFRALAETLT